MEEADAKQMMAVVHVCVRGGILVKINFITLCNSKSEKHQVFYNCLGIVHIHVSVTTRQDNNTSHFFHLLSSQDPEGTLYAPQLRSCRMYLAGCYIH